MSFIFKEEHVFPAVIAPIVAAARDCVHELCATEKDDAALSAHFYRDLGSGLIKFIELCYSWI